MPSASASPGNGETGEVTRLLPNELRVGSRQVQLSVTGPATR